MKPLRVVVVFALLLCALQSSLVFAQTCEGELEAGLSTNDLLAPATGRSAALMMKRAVDLLEPSLPPLQRVVNLPVAADDRDRSTFAYLADRQLLDASWQAVSFSADAWNAALSKIASWYEVQVPPLASPAPSNKDLLQSFEPIMAQAGAALDPVAVMAFDTQDPSKIAFWATLRNGVYPRLIVKHPPASQLDLHNDVEGAMKELSSCVYTIKNYVYAPADVALKLFVATNESRMVILSGVPEFEQYILEVPSGQEPDYLTFSTADAQDKEQYTALFLGPSVGFGTLLTMLPQLRTNMSPSAILGFLNNK